MSKVILIHANCHNPSARGDYTFAASIAKDLVEELEIQAGIGVPDIDVYLVSTLSGIQRFQAIYGNAVDGRINVMGSSIGLSSLESFDAVENSVIAFIDANRCKHSPGDIIKRTLSPDNKFIFIGNANQQSYSGLFIQTLFHAQIRSDQPSLYAPFVYEDVLIGSAGLGEDRLSCPSTKICLIMKILLPPI